MNRSGQLLLAIAALVIGATIWIVGNSASAPREGQPDPTERSLGAKVGDAVLLDDPGVDTSLSLQARPAEDAERAPGIPSVTETNDQVLLRGVVMDSSKLPVTAFTVTVTPGEWFNEAGYLDLSAQGQLGQWNAEHGGTKFDFEHDQGEFEVLVPMGHDLLVTASAGGFNTYTWSTQALSLDPDSTLAINEHEGRRVIPAEACLPKAPSPIHLTLTRMPIAGRVVLPTGAPCGRASVRIYVKGVLMRTVETDPWGEFGTYIDGYLEWHDEILLTAGHEDWVASLPTPLSLTEARPLPLLQLILRAGGRLEGSVVNPNGAPTIGFVDVTYEAGPGLDGSGFQSVRTLDGQFAFDRLIPGTHIVKFQPQGQPVNDPLLSTEAWMIGDVEIVEGETAHLILGAPSAGTVWLKGKLTRDGVGVPNGSVSAIPEGRVTEASWSRTRTNEHGEYAMSLRGPGPYVVMAAERPGGPVTVETLVTVPDAETFDLDLAIPTGSIGGRLTDARGLGVTDATITVMGARHSFMDLAEGQRAFRSDEDGQFLITGLPADTYTIQVTRKRGGGTAAQGGIVISAAHPHRDVDFQLKAQGALLVIVVDALGTPVPGATVFLRTENGSMLDTGTELTTNSHGESTFDEVPTLPFTIIARKGARTSLESAPMRVPADTLGRLTLPLIEGTMLAVTSVDGQGRNHSATVTVQDAEGRDWSTMLSMEDLERQRTAGFSSSQIRTGPLPPGTYLVSATDLAGDVVHKTISLQGETDVQLELKF
mgnify:CR=1 FL=1